MANNDVKEPLLSGSLDETQKVKRQLNRRRLHRSRSAPHTEGVPSETQGKESTPQTASIFQNLHPNFKRVAIYLAVYLGVGALIFFLVRDQIKGTKTNGILDALYFTIVTMTTVGYGDLVPNSHLTKLFACAFVFSGMALIGITVSKAADYLVEKQELLIVKAMHMHQKVGLTGILRELETNKTRYKLFVVFFLLLILIIAGIIFLVTVEKLDVIDAFYCVCSTITTLGYGDKSFSTQAGRIFAVFWILTGTITLAQFFLYIAELNSEIRQKELVKWVLTRKVTNLDLEAAGNPDLSSMRRPSTLVDVLLVLALLSCSPWIVWSNTLCQETNDEVRPHSVSITEFGAVGDGVTLNTKAFQNAIFYLNSFADKGGAKLFVPDGRWLTGSFDLISHLTLWLDKDAVILGSTNPEDWPVVDPLPSYGRGRELPGKRHKSLIYGRNLSDVIITGNNGTIDGQGSIWWSMFRNKTLDYTRPHLIELMNSTGVLISNLTFLNSPFWTLHPVYCSHVTVQKVTIFAPLDSPNTDGIDPDSSDNVCIEDCYISTGDDLIAIKSGWDEYGIRYGRPCTNIIIHRLVGKTQTSAGIAIGSEMSGGVSEVHIEDIQFYDSHTAIRIKTSPGRGGYVRNIYVTNVTLANVDIAIRFTGLYGEHPDDAYDPKALPVIEKITIKDVVGENIKTAGLIEGIEGDNFVNVCLSNIVLNVSSNYPWNCSYVKGYSDLVLPEACEPLKERIFPEHCSDCYYLSNQIQSSKSQNRGAWFMSW